VDGEIRVIAAGELDEFVETVHVSWGHHATDEDREDARRLYEPARCFAALVGGRIVGGTATLSLELTVPGGGTLGAAGVTDAGVLPTHRRLGLFRELNALQLEDAREHGEAVAVLTPSEGTIYGRFGYGVAAFSHDVEVARSAAAFGDPTAVAGEVRLLGPEDCREVLPEVFDRDRPSRPGEVSRTAPYWEAFLRDHDGGSGRFVVAHEAPGGGVDGYAVYRVRPAWSANVPEFGLAVDEVVAVSPAVRAALWRYLLDIDLVGTVTASNAPLDDPLRWLLADPRAYRVTAMTDTLWLRVVDVEAALAARRYAAPGRLVIAVEDPFLPANTGRYLLDGGTVARADAMSPDLSMRAADLGAAYLGGVRFSTLARAGRVVEHTPGTVAVADAMFATDPLPHCTTDV
jgi:predicted acetyltransferase